MSCGGFPVRDMESMENWKVMMKCKCCFDQQDLTVKEAVPNSETLDLVNSGRVHALNPCGARGLQHRSVPYAFSEQVKKAFDLEYFTDEAI